MREAHLLQRNKELNPFLGTCTYEGLMANSPIHKRRVHFVNRFYYPDESATSAMLTDLINGLDTSTYDVSVITGKSYYTSDLGELPAHEMIGDVNVRRIASLRVFNGSMLGRIINYILFHFLAAFLVLKNVRRGDIVVCLTDPPLLSVTLFGPTLLKGGQLVNWVQDIFPEVAAGLSFGGPLSKLAPILQPVRDAVWRRSAMNVVIGDRMGDLVQSRGVIEDRISVIPNWCDELALTPQNDRGLAIRQEWGLSEDDFIVMYSGNLGRAHDISTILGAMKELHRSGLSQVKFVFVGGGAQSEALRNSIKAAGINSAYFFPYRPKSELAQSLSVGDVHWISLAPELEGMIVPSKFFGVGAVARPSIFVGSEDGELAQIQREADCGWQVNQGDSQAFTALVQRLLADPREVAIAGQNARRALETILHRRARISQWQNLLEALSAEGRGTLSSGEPAPGLANEARADPAE